MINLSPASEPHWTEKYLPVPWKENGTTMEGLSCWGLVQHVQRERYGRNLPDIHLDAETKGSENFVVTVLNAIRENDWRRMVETNSVLEGDVLLAKRNSEWHVGVIIGDIRGLPRVLHSMGAKINGSAVGGVVVHTMGEFTSLGFSKIQIWRATS
jgi:cell wall-associated NlpC family hydrolase